MAQALARLRFDVAVTKDDVDEALRLIDASKSSLYESVDYDADTTNASKIYKVIRDIATRDGDSSQTEWSMRSVRERVLARGFTEDQFADCIKEYEELGVLITVDSGTKLVFVDATDVEMDQS